MRQNPYYLYAVTIQQLCKLLAFIQRWMVLWKVFFSCWQKKAVHPYSGEYRTEDAVLYQNSWFMFKNQSDNSATWKDFVLYLVGNLSRVSSNYLINKNCCEIDLQIERVDVEDWIFRVSFRGLFRLMVCQPCPMAYLPLQACIWKSWFQWDQERSIFDWKTIPFMTPIKKFHSDILELFCKHATNF